MRRAFIKEHDDVGAQIALDFHGGLGANEGGCAVEVVLEMDTLLGDLAEFGEGEDLEAAAVGEDRTVP